MNSSCTKQPRHSYNYNGQNLVPRAGRYRGVPLYTQKPMLNDDAQLYMNTPFVSVQAFQSHFHEPINSSNTF